MVERLRQHARLLKRDTYALYLAYHDPRTPWYARIVAACVVAYAFSPIDLIPDFVPILGYLDDLILVPLGMTLALRLIHAHIMNECREQAQHAIQRPNNWVLTVLIIAVWIGLAMLALWWLGGWFKSI